MKFDGIEAFVAAVEAGSITEAARKLRLSKSVVSERLTELERSLGAKLLQRTTRKLSLTEDGSAFHGRAARIMREIEDAAADISERRGTLSGPLRLSAPVTFGRMHLGPALYPFLAEHPEIQPTLDLDDRRVDAAAAAMTRWYGMARSTRAALWCGGLRQAVGCFSHRQATSPAEERPGRKWNWKGTTVSSTQIAASPIGAS
jgi:molybdenum-dependent DNA-binding transcriptional regulator ModE